MSLKKPDFGQKLVATRVSERTLNYIKITSDKEKKLLLHLIVLILKTFQTSMKDNLPVMCSNVETSTKFGQFVKKRNVVRNVLNTTFMRKVKRIFTVV